MIDERNLNFEPKIFFRCHSKTDKDYADVKTQVWQALFKPNSFVVATCGGNKVCLINVLTGEVEQRYTTTDIRDILYSVAWGKLTRGIKNYTVLVAGGVRSTIYFIYPKRHIMFREYKVTVPMKANITSLLFHPCIDDVLLCATNKGDIFCYKIDMKYNMNETDIIHQLTLSLKCEIHMLVFCSMTQTLLAATDNGLKGCILRHVETSSKPKILKLCIHQSKFSTELVDSVEVIGNGLVCAKWALSGLIYIWDMNCLDCNESQINIIPKYILKWSDTDNYFMGITAHIDAGLLSCGDDKGRIWIYDIKSIEQYPQSSNETSSYIKVSQILQWPILNDRFVAKSRKLDLDTYDIVVAKAAIHFSAFWLCMDLAKSLFVSNVRDGYAGKQDNIQIETAVSDDEEANVSNCPLAADDYEFNDSNDTDLLASYEPVPGGPFSAVTPSMWPQDFLIQNKCKPDTFDFKIDEFGFHVDEYQNEYHKHNKLNHERFLEDSQSRLQWLAQLEFSQGDDLTWENVSITLPHTDKLGEMVKNGIPHSLRTQLWMRFSGALAKKQSAEMSYRDIVKSSNFDHLASSHTIEKDVLRTLPGNACFSSKNSTGVARLRRILRAINWFFPDIGYCQGMGVIVAHLLLFMEEEDSFWTMVTIMEDLLPASYYVNGLTGVMADIRVLRNLITTYLPDIHDAFIRHDVDITLTGMSWFVPVFSNVLHIKLLLRVWDLFFFYGSITIFRIALGILKLTECEMLNTDSLVVIYNALNDAPGKIDDIQQLLQVSFETCSTLTVVTIDNYRRKHQAYIMVDRGTLIGNPEAAANLPKQHLSRRQIRKSKSVIQLILFGDEITEEDIKNKNIRQTELMVDLRDAIMQIAHHFISVDPKLSNVSLVPDYSVASHSKDHEMYNMVSKSRRRRAKALLDFERHDDDELGFRKNDIITVISQKDEHCWVGELNGLKGWFPAKFVELLDERSKQYSSAGDDSVTETVTDLVRGTLCPAIKQILEHGMRRPSFLGGPCHPWLFIEEAAMREVEKDFSSVYSRLMLCKTYRLDEDGKVLTPEEVLYRCIQSVNQTHDNAHVQMDVKLRSLVCFGLNEQVLHIWLEIVCSCVEIVQKWYHPWSFVCSPGWVQIKCELRIMSQFPFNLNPDFELPPRKEKSQPLKDGVRDMLVKHHLFSWDL